MTQLESLITDLHNCFHMKERVFSKVLRRVVANTTAASLCSHSLDPGKLAQDSYDEAFSCSMKGSFLGVLVKVSCYDAHMETRPGSTVQGCQHLDFIFTAKMKSLL